MLVQPSKPFIDKATSPVCSFGNDIRPLLNRLQWTINMTFISPRKQKQNKTLLCYFFMVISTLLHFLEQSPKYPRDMPILDSCPHAPGINTWVRSVTRLISPFNPGLAMQESGKCLAPELYVCSPFQIYPFDILIWLLFSCLFVCEIRIHTTAQADLELKLAASASQILGLQIPITLYSYRSVQTLTGVVI